MDLCRRAARLALGRDRLQQIETLPLPQSLKNYLQYQWCGQIYEDTHGHTQVQASRCSDSSAMNRPPRENVYTTIWGYYQRCSVSSYFFFYPSGFRMVCGDRLWGRSVRMPQRRPPFISSWMLGLGIDKHNNLWNSRSKLNGDAQNIPHGKPSTLETGLWSRSWSGIRFDRVLAVHKGDH